MLSDKLDELRVRFIVRSDDLRMPPHCRCRAKAAKQQEGKEEVAKEDEGAAGEEEEAEAVPSVEDAHMHEIKLHAAEERKQARGRILTIDQ